MRTSNNGLIYVFTGDGKGKTSAALGITLRMLSLRKRVVWISWYKTPDWQVSEMRLPLMLTEDYRSKLKMYWTGKGFYLFGKKEASVAKAKIRDRATAVDHMISARQALGLAEDCLKKQKTDLLVLDEFIKAVDDGLVEGEAAVKLIEERRGCHMILTGRGKIDWLDQGVDLISEIKKIKHPFDNGKLAVAGLDF